jgi:hypothetical protein
MPEKKECLQMLTYLARTNTISEMMGGNKAEEKDRKGESLSIYIFYYIGWQ